MTRKQLEAARNRAENRVNEWYDRYLDELDCLYVRRKNGHYVSLLDKFGQSAALDTDANPISQRINCDVYEDDDWRYRECTQRAIKRLRRIEDKINEWNARYCELDFAFDACRE